MYQNILIPTDGSHLAAKAVEHGVLLAKEIGAKVTAVMVTEPFHMLLVAPSQIEYTRAEYKKHVDAEAEKALGVVSAAAKQAGVACETLHVEHEHVYQAIIDAGASKACDLVAMAVWTSRRLGRRPWERDGQSANATAAPDFWTAG